MNEFWLGVTFGVIGVFVFSTIVALLMARWLSVSGDAIEEEPIVSPPIMALNGHHRRQLPVKDQRL